MRRGGASQLPPGGILVLALPPPGLTSGGSQGGGEGRRGEVRVCDVCLESCECIKKVRMYNVRGTYP